MRLSQDKRWIIWKMSTPDSPPISNVNARQDGPGRSQALDAVVDIVRSEKDSPTAIALRAERVARTFGPLYLCGHGRPLNHPSEGTPPELHSQCIFDPLMDGERSERIADWCAFAIRVRNLIDFAARVSSARNFGEVRALPEGEQVERFRGGILISNVEGGGIEAGPVPQEPYDRTKAHVAPVELSAAHDWITMRVDVLLEEARVTPSVEWNSNKARFEFGVRPAALGLYGTVVLQLARRIGGSDREMECDGCRKIYFRPTERKMPGPSQLNFCDVCSDDEGLKRRIQRAKKRRTSNGG